MPIRRGPRNNVLAGVFLLSSLALAIAIVFILSNIWDRLTVPTSRYHVLFTLDEGAEGLDKGAYVKIGGERVGRVVGWGFTPPTGVPTGIDVEIEIRSDIRLYEDATPQLVLPLLGSNSTVNFPFLGDGKSVQDPQHGDPLLQPGESIRGQLAAPAFLAQAGYGPKQKKQVQQIIDDVQAITTRFDAATARVDKDLDPAIDQVKSILGDVSSITADAKERWKAWQEQFADAIARIQESAKTLAATMEDAREGVKDARGAITSVREAIDENRPKVDSSLTDIQDLTHKLNTDSYAAVKELLDKGQKAMDEVVASARRLSTLLERRSPDLEQIVANGRLASDQIKLAAIEVRAAPWKLLSKPTGRKELENEVLYDSVRAYASAVSDLRSAAAALESVSASRAAPGVHDPIERRSVEEVTKALHESFDRYQKAEQDFLRRWSQSK